MTVIRHCTPSNSDQPTAADSQHRSTRVGIHVDPTRSSNGQAPRQPQELTWVHEAVVIRPDEPGRGFPMHSFLLTTLWNMHA